MFSAPPIRSWTKTQERRFEAFKGGLMRFDERQRADEVPDPWLFHGTTALRAAWIRRGGFVGHCADGVFWGRASVATYFARNNSVERADDRPVVIAARLSAVLASGNAAPDLNWDHEPEPRTWNESLEATGCILVRRGYQVDGLRFLEPYGRDLPLTPQAFTDRDERLATASTSLRYGMVPVLPDEEFSGREEICGMHELTVEQWALDLGYNAETGWPKQDVALVP